MKTNILLIATLATLLASCSKDDNNVANQPVEAQITAGIDKPVTRAAEQTWAKDDQIGIMATKGTATSSTMPALYKNVAYKASAAGTSGTFTPSTTGTGIIFQNTTETVTFIAYYPYTSSTDAATLPGTAGVITGADTKSQTTAAAQAAFDYLYAGEATATKTSPTVAFTFKHKMARLVLTIKTSAADGFAADDVFDGTYNLGGLNHAGQFNVTTGVASTTGTTKTADWDITNNLKSDNTTANTRIYSMILYPQDASGSNKLTFKATFDGQAYTTTAIAPNLEAGNSYSYTVTVKKTGLVVSGCTITDWTGNDMGDKEATM